MLFVSFPVITQTVSKKLSDTIVYFFFTSLREIVNQLQMKIIRANNRICVEGRDIASKILAKNPKYDLAFYFKCSLGVAAYRRWLDLKKSVPLNEVKRSLKIRTSLDKKRKNSPLIKVKDAILDVFSTEPIPKNSKLWDTPNLVITPHVSSDSEGNYIEMVLKIFFKNLKLFLEKKELINQIDRKLGY